jgi:MFS transporter, MHS family, shikimate and dehydroshikimate transport protein
MTITATAPAVDVERTKINSIVFASSVGTIIEWYDFLIYATAAALVFNKAFFPTFDPLAGTLAALGSYAVGFVARPLGAALFGHFCDRLGRKSMLVLTLFIMGLSTFCIGLLPTYASIGIFAPVLLILLRIIQGIGLGGEWGGAVLMVVENCPTKKRGFLGSSVQLGYPIGNLAALGMFTLVSQLPESDFLSWGWRIPFLISIFLGGVGLWIRLRMEETAVFQQIKAKNEVVKIPILEIFKYHRRAFFTAVGLKISEIAYASIAGVFIISYATSKLGIPRNMILNGVFASSFVGLFSIPLFGWLSDKVGRKAMFYASCLFSALFAFPLFSLLETRDPTIIVLTFVAAISFGQLVMFGVGAPWYSELFSAKLRYSGASLGFQVGAAISGGLSPLIAVSLMAWAGGATWPVSVYLIFCAAITAIATFAAPEMANKELT